MPAQNPVPRLNTVRKRREVCDPFENDGRDTVRDEPSRGQADEWLLHKLLVKPVTPLPQATLAHTLRSNGNRSLPLAAAEPL